LEGQVAAAAAYITAGVLPARLSHVGAPSPTTAVASAAAAA